MVRTDGEISKARFWNLWFIAKGVSESALLGAASRSSEQGYKRVRGNRAKGKKKKQEGGKRKSSEREVPITIQ